jgi:hypothetical protein
VKRTASDSQSAPSMEGPPETGARGGRPGQRARSRRGSAAAMLPLADYGQDEELTVEQPARRTDRTRLLADPLSGAHPLRRPS